MLCKRIIIVHQTPYPSIETWAAEEEESEEAGWTHFQIWATSSRHQAPAGRDIYQEYLHYTYTHYAVLSHYCKDIFCENSNVRGFL